jgi:N6-adenosine-specific RNA methylase IME4
MSETVTVGGQEFRLLFPDLLRPLTGQERADLRDSIAERGVVVPVIVDESLGVIDGIHRLTVAESLGLSYVPIEIRPMLSDEEKRALAESLNLDRRHLAADERQSLSARLRQQGMSYRAIGERLGVAPNTVRADVREAGVQNCTPEQPATVTGRDGKSYASVRVAPAEAAKASAILQQLDAPPAGPADMRDLRRAATDQGREQKREANAALVAATASPVTHADGVTYQAIAVDPPWDWGDEGDVSQFGRGDPTYATMPFDQLLALPVEALACPDAHLYLWVTNRSLPKGFALMEAWGFRYVTCLTWCKPSVGMGNYFRGSTEHVLFGVRGSLPLLRSDAGTWFAADRQGRHSTKPREFYEMVETCSPGPWLEMFARGGRPGWATWGAEA